MSLIGLVVVLIVIGLVIFLVNSYLPIDPKIKMIINVILVLVVVIWLLQSLGIFSGLDTIRVR